MISGLPIVEGEISRISGSGNAMLEASGGDEFNLGPLEEEVVGEQVRAAKLTGPWALCLDSAYVTEDYLEVMESKSGDSVTTDFRSLIGGSADSDDIGRTVRLKIDSIEGVTRYDDDKPIRVLQQGFLEDTVFSGSIPIEIVAVRNGVAIGVPALERLESDEVEPGDVVEMVVQYVVENGNAAVGSTDDTGFPVYSTDLVATPGAVARVGVLNVFNTHIDTSPTALPQEVWPEEEETIYVTIDRITNSGEGYGLTDGLPVLLPDALDSLSEAERFKTQVTDQAGGIVTAAVDELNPSERAVVNDVVYADVISRTDDGTLCRTGDVPLWIPCSIPDPVETVRCRVLDVNTSHLVGSVAKCPEIQQLNASDELQIRVEHRDGDDGLSVYEGIPVVIPDGRDLVGEDVSLGLIESREGFLVAGVNVLSGVPEVGEMIRISEDEYKSKKGRLCFVNSVPVLLPEGSYWPSGDIRIGVKDVTPAGIRVSIDSLPVEDRPEVGDEIEISISDLEAGCDTVLVDGIPVKIPPNLWQLSGRVCLGVSGVQPNCLRCSIQGLPDELIPEIGELVWMDIDSYGEDTSRGRISGIPALLPRTNLQEGTSGRVLVVEHAENSLIGVDVDMSNYEFELESEAVVNYYRALIKARDAWQEDDFELATQCCRDAANAVNGDSHSAKILRLDAERQEMLLYGEQIRKRRGVREAQREIQEAIESLSLPDVCAASWMIEELKAYRFALTGLSQDGSMTVGYLNASTRAMKKAKNTESSPWREIIPHPLFGTFLASVRKPRSPSSEKADKLANQVPQYWPFLTLSEVDMAI